MNISTLLPHGGRREEEGVYLGVKEEAEQESPMSVIKTHGPLIAKSGGGGSGALCGRPRRTSSGDLNGGIVTTLS